MEHIEHKPPRTATRERPCALAAGSGEKSRLPRLSGTPMELRNEALAPISSEEVGLNTAPVRRYLLLEDDFLRLKLNRTAFTWRTCSRGLPSFAENPNGRPAGPASFDRRTTYQAAPELKRRPYVGRRILRFFCARWLICQ